MMYLLTDQRERQALGLEIGFIVLSKSNCLPLVPMKVLVILTKKNHKKEDFHLAVQEKLTRKCIWKTNHSFKIQKFLGQVNTQ